MSMAESSPRTQEQRRIEAERRLVRAAAELVGEIGPTRVTLANVGERAGYSRGLATHHFGSKAALMQRLVETVTSQFRDAMSKSIGYADRPAAQRSTFPGGLTFGQ
jgi:AcrR family transcriptional regulator